MATRIPTPMTEHERRVMSMMDAFGQNCPAYPTIADAATRRLRVMLLLEEVLEYAEAAGIDLEIGVGGGGDQQTLQIADVTPRCSETRAPDLVGMVDALADISVVNTGAFIAHGVRSTPVLETVDANNLLKYSTGHRHPETGKFIKAPNHPVPDIHLLLLQQGWDPNGD